MIPGGESTRTLWQLLVAVLVGMLDTMGTTLITLRLHVDLRPQNLISFGYSDSTDNYSDIHRSEYCPDTDNGYIPSKLSSLRIKLTISLIGADVNLIFRPASN